jgi:hypothetical protein
MCASSSLAIALKVAARSDLEIDRFEVALLGLGHCEHVRGGVWVGEEDRVCRAHFVDAESRRLDLAKGVPSNAPRHRTRTD